MTDGGEGERGRVTIKFILSHYVTGQTLMKLAVAGLAQSIDKNMFVNIQGFKLHNQWVWVSMST